MSGIILIKAGSTKVTAFNIAELEETKKSCRD
jgi:hypothetical protein